MKLFFSNEIKLKETNFKKKKKKIKRNILQANNFKNS